MILITGAKIFSCPTFKGECDLLIDGKKIVAIDKKGSIPTNKAKTVINAEGQYLLPGLVDVHVHLREPGFEWKGQIKDGSEAAVLGGYTSIACMPNTRPVNDHAEITKFILDKAKSVGLAKIYPIGSVSLGLKGDTMSPLSELRKAGCVAFSDDGEPIHNAGLMKKALEWCLMLDAVIACHEEDKSLTAGGCMNESALSLKLGLKGMPTVGEDVMVARDIELAYYTGGKVHVCHVSTARSVELIRRAKNEGIRVTCEVTPHHLVLNENVIEEFSYDPKYKMSPPLRHEKDRLALIAGLKDGTIDAIASDHAPHEFDSKCCEFDRASFGILGLQTSLPLLMQFVSRGELSMEAAISALAEKPAKIFGMDAGVLKINSDADIVLYNPTRKWSYNNEELITKSLNSPFIGQEFVGKVEHVFVAGKHVVLNGALNVN